MKVVLTHVCQVIRLEHKGIIHSVKKPNNDCQRMQVLSLFSKLFWAKRLLLKTIMAFSLVLITGETSPEPLTIPKNFGRLVLHIFLRQISTIKSHDGGKEGYFGNQKVNSYHL